MEGGRRIGHLTPGVAETLTVDLTGPPPDLLADTQGLDLGENVSIGEGSATSRSVGRYLFGFDPGVTAALEAASQRLGETLPAP